MTKEEERQLVHDYNKMVAENRRLRLKIKDLEESVSYYRELLEKGENGLKTAVRQAINERPVGAPVRIDESTKERIRKLKEQGLTYREISIRENVSLGKISKIINE